MAVQFGLKISSDAGNILSFGTDQGLLATTPPPRGGMFGMAIDNSVATAAAGVSYYYGTPAYSNTNLTWTGTAAQVSPITFARNCRVTAAALRVVTAGAGSAVYVSVYAPDASGTTATKVTDLLRFDTTVAGQRAATVLDSTTVLTAQAHYYLLSWCYTTSAYPVTNVRNGSGTHAQEWRYPSAPAHITFHNSSLMSMAETSQTYSGLTAGPSTISPAYPSMSTTTTTLYLTAPYLWFGLLNV